MPMDLYLLIMVIAKDSIFLGFEGYNSKDNE